jgi:transposase
MGTRKMRERQEDLWYGDELPIAPGHPFYERLNEVLDNAKFDPFCETNCASFYHNKLGRPSLPPGQYFRVMMIGFSRDSTASAASRGASPTRSLCDSSCP